MGTVSDVAESVFWAGRASYALSEYDSAMVHFDKVLSDTPDYPYAHYWRGICRYHLKNYNGAISDFTENIKRNPLCIPAYYWRGLASKEIGDADRAISDLQKVMELQSQDKANKEARSAPIPQEGPANYREMARDMKEALYEEPKIRQKLAPVRTKDMEEKLVKELKGGPTATDTQVISMYYWSGWEKEEKGDFAGAMKDFDAVIKTRPNDARAFASRARVREKTNDFIGAI
ncbi:tetratricopeptide repeat protein, partial [Candidatus Peregrinibacteria bacterium]|nr:tetratricopeptide repeat protein [Candidatus Peregrinibacteria bacterium]